MSDNETYKRLFAFPRMVQDLLRGFVPGLPADELDYSTLERLSDEYVGDAERIHRGDAVWRVARRGARGHMLVLLVFQWANNPGMAVQILRYTTLAYQELARNRRLEPGGLLPPVLPVVLYIGDEPWAAARELGDLIEPGSRELAPYQPSQSYVVLDLRHAKVEGDPAPR